MAAPFQVTIDCVDAERMCRFWSTALGYVEEPPPAGYLSWEDFLRANDIPVPSPGSIAAIVDPDGIGPRILFVRATQRDQLGKRVHLDVRAGRNDADKQRKVDELQDAGATPLRRIDDHGQWWMLMADPEGNEFCVT